MNLTWEAYKQAEANKPQSDLLKEWYVKTSFSDNETPPEELVRILEENQKEGSKANIVKLELEFWDKVKASRKEGLEKEIFHLRQARVSCPGHEVAGWNKKLLPLLHEDPRFKSSHVECHFEGNPVQNPVLLPADEQSLVYTLIPELKKKLWWTTAKGRTPAIEVRLFNERNFCVKEINQEFSFLFGSQHYNRLARGVKVFILSGPYKNYYGIVVGHAFGFDLNSSDPPILKILLTNSVRDLQVRPISQHLVKLIDLKGSLPFYVPAKAPLLPYHR